MMSLLADCRIHVLEAVTRLAEVNRLQALVRSGEGLSIALMIDGRAVLPMELPLGGADAQGSDLRTQAIEQLSYEGLSCWDAIYAAAKTAKDFCDQQKAIHAADVDASPLPT